MHFSIPDTQEFYNEENGTPYIGYNIHINGLFHCCLRYKQLHNFNEQLKKKLSHIVSTKLNSSNSTFLFNSENFNKINGGSNNAVTISVNGREKVKRISIHLPEFPPKKFLPLTQNQIETRRTALENYIQLLGQDPILSKTDHLLSFFLNAQQNTSGHDRRPIVLDIFLMNGFKIETACWTTDSSSTVMANACKKILLPEEMNQYFSLFLMNKKNENNINLVRKLMDFESPYLTQKLLSDCQIVIRKCYWNPCHDKLLLNNSIGLNLLYIQTVSDVLRDWIIPSEDVKLKLNKFHENGNKKEYLELSKKLSSYGCILFSNAIVNYPEENSICHILLGNNELSFRTVEGVKIQEIKFKVTRMRCWRVTTIHEESCEGDPSNSINNFTNQRLKLSFEYLMNKNLMQWITITSENAMLMSVFLQGMVEELIDQKEEFNHTEVLSKPGYSNIVSESSSTDTISCSNDGDTQYATRESLSVKSKSQNKISTTVFFTKKKETVFEEIGDDDL